MNLVAIDYLARILPNLTSGGDVPTYLIIAAVGITLSLFLLMITLAKRFRKVGPNEAMIIYGMSPPKVIFHGGALVWPMVQRAEVISLEAHTIDLCSPEVYTEEGIPFVFEGIALIGVKRDSESILFAAQRLLGQGQEKVHETIGKILDLHLRAQLTKISVDDVYKHPEMLATKVKEASGEELVNMGLQIESLTMAALTGALMKQPKDSEPSES
jgi:flotillin